MTPHGRCVISYLIGVWHARACRISTNREVDIINVIVKERLCGVCAHQASHGRCPPLHSWDREDGLPSQTHQRELQPDSQDTYAGTAESKN